MDIQLIEVYVPKEAFSSFNHDIENYDIIKHWTSHESNDYTLVRILVNKQDSEDILNYLEASSQQDDRLKALLFSLKTYIPHSEEEENLEKRKDSPEDEQKLKRASRHELYSVVHSSSRITKSFSWFLVLSSLVATAGIVKNSPAIVIGAMMIAPLIGPFSAIAFASVLGDYRLLRQSLLSSLYGLALPLSVSIMFGYFFPLPMDSQEFLSRTNIEIIDIVAALASGAAGAISFLKRVSEAFVGVMVSVALLPPAVVLGMTIGDASWDTVLTPLLLLLVNISSIVLSAIVVYWLSGIEPVKWADIQDAQTSRKFALLFVSIIILVLLIAIYLIKF